MGHKNKIMLKEYPFHIYVKSKKKLISSSKHFAVQTVWFRVSSGDHGVLVSIRDHSVRGRSSEEVPPSRRRQPTREVDEGTFLVQPGEDVKGQLPGIAERSLAELRPVRQGFARGNRLG